MKDSYCLSKFLKYKNWVKTVIPVKDIQKNCAKCCLFVVGHWL